MVIYNPRRWGVSVPLATLVKDFPNHTYLAFFYEITRVSIYPYPDVLQNRVGGCRPPALHIPPPVARIKGHGSGSAAALRQPAVTIYTFSILPEPYPRPASPAATHGLPCHHSGASPSPSPQVSSAVCLMEVLVAG